MNVSNNVHGLRVYCFLLKLSFLSSRFEPLLKKKPSFQTFVRASILANEHFHLSSNLQSIVRIGIPRIISNPFSKSYIYKFLRRIKKHELYETVFQKYNQFFSKSRSVKLNYIIKKKQSIFLPTLLRTHLRTHFFRSRINQTPFGVPAPRDRGGKTRLSNIQKEGPVCLPLRSRASY